jgi:hypothetical protein
VGIRWRELQDGGVERNAPREKQRRHVGQKHGHEVRGAFLDGLSDRRAGKERDLQ